MSKLGGIPLSWLIQVNSTGIKEAFSLSKLHSLAITKYSKNNPNDKWLSFYDSDSVANTFGFDSLEYNFALNYFSVTNKKSSKADLLTFYVWNSENTSPAIKGARVDDLAKLKTLNGKVAFTIGSTKKDVTINLTQTNSYSDVANKIQEAIRSAGAATTGNNPTPAISEFSLAEVNFSTISGGLIVKSGVKGENATIDFISPPSSGTDISSNLGLNSTSGATIINGYNAQATFSNALSEIDSVNGNYYVIDTTFELDDNDALSLAQFIDNSNDRFLGIINSPKKVLIQNENAFDNIRGYNGIIINYYSSNKPYGFVAGIISSIDFALENGNINIAFNDATKYEAEAINTKEELNILEANKANAILKFGQMGQSQIWYGMGNILGTKTNSANVYIANSYLMFSLQYAFANLLHNQAFIGLRGTFNNGLMINVASEVFNKAVNANIVAVGATLTDTERQVIISTFGSESETALKQLENTGYYVKIGKIDLSNQVVNLTTAYVANKNLKRIIINNYILGA